MDALITYAQLAEHYGIAITTMRNRVYRGDAPVPVLGPGGPGAWIPTRGGREIRCRAHQDTQGILVCLAPCCARRSPTRACG